MDQEILKRIEAQDEKLERIYRSVEQTRRYLLWAFIITVVAVVIPLIGLAVLIPQMLSSYSSGLGI